MTQPAADVTYDPIADEKRLYTIREFEKILKDAVADYAQAFDGANEFTRKPHTFNDWMDTFGRFMSW